MKNPFKRGDAQVDYTAVNTQTGTSTQRTATGKTLPEVQQKLLRESRGGDTEIVAPKVVKKGRKHG